MPSSISNPSKNMSIMRSNNQQKTHFSSVGSKGGRAPTVKYTGNKDNSVASQVSSYLRKKHSNRGR